MPRFKKGSKEAKDWAAKMRANQQAKPAKKPAAPAEPRKEDLGLPPDDKPEPAPEAQQQESPQYLGHCSDCGADIHAPKPAKCPVCEAPL